MNTVINKSVIHALGLGLISGTRATLATTIAAHYLSRQTNKNLQRSRLRFIQRGASSVVTKVLTAAEIAGGKLPNVPDRTTPAALLARVPSGAFSVPIVDNANDEN